jgi:uncharacterized protein YqeY
MTLIEQIQDDIKTAMRARAADQLTALRTLMAQVKDAGVNQGKELTDGDTIGIVTKAIKQRADALEQFRQAGRTDLADKESREIEWYKKYLPPSLSEAEITDFVKQAIAESGAASKKEMGKVMQVLMPKVKGRADGKLVNQIVQSLLP